MRRAPLLSLLATAALLAGAVTVAVTTTAAPPAGAATNPPSLTSPATGSLNPTTVTVTGVLPDTPLAGSVQII
ncbi:MAG: hypothetical protein ACOYOP_13545 [Microthrixaceae bacterium]